MADTIMWSRSNQVNTNLVIKLNGGSTEGTNLFTYNGSTTKTVNITASSVGAAASNHTHNYAAASHNHSAANITSGTLPVSRGGTGVTSNPSMLVNLASTSAASVFAASPRPGITGTLSIAHGGTGATSASAARTALGAAASSHGTHVTYSTAAPKALGEASAGTASTVARSDHVHPLEKKTKRYVLIADSLGVGLGSNPNRGWTYYFKQELGLSNTDCYIAQTSGYGFVANNNGFKRLLQGVNASSPETITDVICLGGLNDTNVSNPTLAAMSAAVDDFVNTAISKFPNATVHIGQLGRSRDNVNCLNRIITINLPAMKQNQKAHYVAGCENLCHDYWRMSDTWHLDAEYYQEIGIKIARNYETYIPVAQNLYEDTSKYVNCTISSNFGSNSYFKYRCYQNDNICGLYSGECYLEGKNNIKISEQYFSLQIASQGYETLFRGNSQGIIPIVGFFGLKASTGGTVYFHCLPATLAFRNTDGAIFLNFYNVYNQQTSWFNGYFWNAQFKIPSFSIDALYV